MVCTKIPKNAVYMTHAQWKAREEKNAKQDRINQVLKELGYQHVTAPEKIVECIQYCLFPEDRPEAKKDTQFFMPAIRTEPVELVEEPKQQPQASTPMDQDNEPPQLEASSILLWPGNSDNTNPRDFDGDGLKAEAACPSFILDGGAAQVIGNLFHGKDFVTQIKRNIYSVRTWEALWKDVYYGLEGSPDEEMVNSGKRSKFQSDVREVFITDQMDDGNNYEVQFSFKRKHHARLVLILPEELIHPDVLYEWKLQ